MTREELHDLAAGFPKLRIAVIGDFCLDRYLEIDPARAEISIETELPVHNVVNVRAQPGAAGTVLNNLVALGVGHIIPVGFCGEDGEGYELLLALQSLPGVDLAHFIQTPLRRTFTYCKPLIISPGESPRELSRLDSKNWSRTPDALTQAITASIESVANEIDAAIVLDQMDMADTGVVTASLLATVGWLAQRVPTVSDSRRGLSAYPPCVFKMNAAEFAALAGTPPNAPVEEVRQTAAAVARRHEHPVIVTLAERGIIGAAADGTTEHVPALPGRGPIDVVGAGDSVTANVTAALATGATFRQALELAALASSIVVHQLGTSGTATVGQMSALLGDADAGL